MDERTNETRHDIYMHYRVDLAFFFFFSLMVFFVFYLVANCEWCLCR